MHGKQWIVAFESTLYNDWHEFYSKSFLKLNKNKKKVSANQIAQRVINEQARVVLTFGAPQFQAFSQVQEKAKWNDEIFKWIICQCARLTQRTQYLMHTDLVKTTENEGEWNEFFKPL